MLAVTVIEGRSTTETVPVIAAPTTWSATISVPADQIWKSASRSGSATLVADVGGRAVAGDHDAVRRVADADLRALLLRGQVDLGERVVLVQQGVSALAVL